MTDINSYKELVILIAEDDEGHAELIKQELIDSGVCNKIIRFVDGEDVWNFLSGTGSSKGYESAKKYLLLLDIKMPRMDGLELLKKIKSSASLKEIPVIMLTTSNDAEEVEACYKAGCNMYISKSIQIEELADILYRMGLFLQIVII